MISQHTWLHRWWCYCCCLLTTVQHCRPQQAATHSITSLSMATVARKAWSVRRTWKEPNQRRWNNSPTAQPTEQLFRRSLCLRTPTHKCATLLGIRNMFYAIRWTLLSSHDAYCYLRTMSMWIAVSWKTVLCCTRNTLGVQVAKWLAMRLTCRPMKARLIWSRRQPRWTHEHHECKIECHVTSANRFWSVFGGVGSRESGDSLHVPSKFHQATLSMNARSEAGHLESLR